MQSLRSWSLVGWFYRADIYCTVNLCGGGLTGYPRRIGPTSCFADNSSTRKNYGSHQNTQESVNRPTWGDADNEGYLTVTTTYQPTQKRLRQRFRVFFVPKTDDFSGKFAIRNCRSRKIVVIPRRLRPQILVGPNQSILLLLRVGVSPISSWRPLHSYLDTISTTCEIHIII